MFWIRCIPDEWSIIRGGFQSPSVHCPSSSLQSILQLLNIFLLPQSLANISLLTELFVQCLQIRFWIRVHEPCKGSSCWPSMARPTMNVHLVALGFVSSNERNGDLKNNDITRNHPNMIRLTSWKNIFRYLSYRMYSPRGPSGTAQSDRLSASRGAGPPAVCTALPVPCTLRKN